MMIFCFYKEEMSQFEIDVYLNEGEGRFRRA